MKLVKHWMNLPNRALTKGDVGIEIEVEGRNLPHLTKYWRNEKDGSLRGEENAEYVLKVPSTLQEAKVALDYLDHTYTEIGSEVDETVRAGVHVHVNCQDLTAIQLFNFITLYIVFEEMLVRWCGPHREGNLFCLRSGDAEYQISVLRRGAKSKGFRLFDTDNLRYGSMNVRALSQYGSLEFRAMRGTRDLSLVHQWAEMLVSLREVACQYDSPQQVIEYFSGIDIDTFIVGHLGKHGAVFSLYEDREKLLRAGMRRAQDIAFCTDWHKTYDEPPVRIIGGLEFKADEDPDEPEGDI